MAMKVTFDFDKRQILIDGDAKQMVDVLVAAQTLAPMLTHIQINAGASPPQNRETKIEVGTAVEQSQAQQVSGRTMKQFSRQLQLENAYERVAAIAYYAKLYENRQAFSPKEMSDWFGHCGFAKPTQMGVVLFDAKRRHNYVESAGHGQYKLTTNGDNLVIGKLNKVESAQAQ
jgi:hypothetical protein